MWHLPNVAGRSLEYFDMEANEKIVDGEERARLLRHSVSQDTMWHGAAQTIEVTGKKVVSS